MKDEKQPTVASPIEPVVSKELLVQAEYDGYRAYHTYTRLDSCPYSGELRKAWLLGQSKASKEG